MRYILDQAYVGQDVGWRDAVGVLRLTGALLVPGVPVEHRWGRLWLPGLSGAAKPQLASRSSCRISPVFVISAAI